MLDGRCTLVGALVVLGVLGASGTAWGDVIYSLEGTEKVQVKANGYKFRQKLPESVTVTLADDGTFLPDRITAGAWAMNVGKGKGKGRGNKVDVWVGEADIANIAASYADELDVTAIQLDGVKKFRLKPVITRKGLMKANLKLDGWVTVPDLGLEGARFKVRGLYKGYEAPEAPGGGPDPAPEPASILMLAVGGAIALLKRRRR